MAKLFAQSGITNHSDTSYGSELPEGDPALVNQPDYVAARTLEFIDYAMLQALVDSDWTFKPVDGETLASFLAGNPVWTAESPNYFRSTRDKILKEISNALAVVQAQVLRAEPVPEVVVITAGDNGWAVEEESPVETMSPALKSWFGRSKIINEDGTPMVCYHATARDFDAFAVGGYDSTVSGHAIWLSPYPEYQAAAHNVTSRKPGARVLPLYVKMERPLLIDDMNSLTWARGVFAQGSEQFPQLLPKKWVEEVTRDGEYDGIIFDGESLGWGEHSNELIVFNPNQVKSAIGNSGAYDPGDNRVTAAVNPVETPAFKSWFAGSKIVDAQGQPLRCFHGTPHDFDQFKEGSGYGIWFATEGTLDEAELAILDEASMSDIPLIPSANPDVEPSYPEGSRIIPVYINLKNPAALTGDFKEEDLIAAGHDGGVYRDASGAITCVVALRSSQVKSAIGSGFSPNDNRITAAVLPPEPPASPAFKSWFAGSKMVNAQGKPIRFFHGTNRAFDTFAPSDRGGLIYFTPDMEEANGYAESKWEAEEEAIEEHGALPGEDNASQVYPVYLKVVNPFDPDNPAHRALLGKKLGNPEQVEERLSGRHPNYGPIEMWSQQIRACGFDGAWVRESDGLGDHNRDMAVFSPNQIKSAVGNTGNFDPKDKRITASERKIKSRVNYRGFAIGIEFPEGSTRKGVAPDGTAWERPVVGAYGRFIDLVDSADGEALDVWLGDDEDSDHVFIVNQLRPDGGFDEHKALLGFPTVHAALVGYLSNMPDDWTAYEPLKTLTLAEFRRWVQTGDGQKKVAETIKNDTYSMPLGEAIDEHVELVDFLAHPTKAEDLKELADQGGELKEMEAAKAKEKRASLFKKTAKFKNDDSMVCPECHGHLRASSAPVANPKHIYTWGIMYTCGCGKAKVWANSLRNPEKFVAWIAGMEPKYYGGFCNDIFCGHCFNLYYAGILKNGFDGGDLHGCENPNCPSRVDLDHRDQIINHQLYKSSPFFAEKYGEGPLTFGNFMVNHRSFEYNEDSTPSDLVHYFRANILTRGPKVVGIPDASAFPGLQEAMAESRKRWEAPSKVGGTKVAVGGGQYLYHGTTTEGALGILAAGAISSTSVQQTSSSAQTKLPVVCLTRNWEYASGGRGSEDQSNGIGHDVVFVFNRVFLQQRFKVIEVSQSDDTRGMPNTRRNVYRQYDAVSKAYDTNQDGRIDENDETPFKDDQETLQGLNHSWKDPKAGHEFEEDVVVPKGSLPTQAAMGIWVNPNSAAAQNPELMANPWRLEIVKGKFVAVNAQSRVASGSQFNADLKVALGQTEHLNQEIVLTPNGVPVGDEPLAEHRTLLRMQMKDGEIHIAWGTPAMTAHQLLTVQHLMETSPDWSASEVYWACEPQKGGLTGSMSVQDFLSMGHPADIFRAHAHAKAAGVVQEEAHDYAPADLHQMVNDAAAAHPLPKRPHPTETQEFKAWFGSSVVKDPSGAPKVVYHGSTHAFEAFDTSKGDPEGFYGPGIYFSSSKRDVGENYAGVGSDLQSRIDRRADELSNDLEFSDEWSGAPPQYGSAEYKSLSAFCYDKARKELVGESEGMIYLTYLRIEKPVYVQPGGGTRFALVNERTGAPSGFLTRLHKAYLKACGNEAYAKDVERCWDTTMEALGYEYVCTAYEFEQAVRNDYSYDMVPGGPGPLISKIYQLLGFDGIIQDAHAAFTSMLGVEPGTSHYIVWNPKQVKSAIGNRGTFSRRNPSMVASLFQKVARPADATLMRIPGTTAEDIQAAMAIDKDKYLGWLLKQKSIGTVDLVQDAPRLKQALHVLSILKHDPKFTGHTDIKAYTAAKLYALIEDTVDPVHQIAVDQLMTSALSFEDFYDNLTDLLGSDLKPFLQSVGGVPRLRQQWDRQRGVAEDLQQSLDTHRISPRKPKTKKEGAGEDPNGKKKLQPEIKAWETKPKALERAVAVFSSYPGFGWLRDPQAAPGPDGEPGVAPPAMPLETKVQKLVKQLAENLIWLFKQVPEEQRERSKMWYAGGNRLVHRWSRQFSIDPHKISGVVAVLSPQRDWFQNISLAERVMTIFQERQDMLWNQEMTDVVVDWVKRAEADKQKVRERYLRKRDKDALAMQGITAGVEDEDTHGEPVNEEEAEEDELAMLKLVPLCEGKTLAALLKEPTLAALWIRAFDQTYNYRHYRIVSPEGEFGDWARNTDYSQQTVTWSSLSAVAKAVVILRSQTVRDISDTVGENHKVRSFYNNLIAPHSKGQDVTIDTHAVAAALVRPLASSSREVSHNFGTSKKGDPIKPMADAMGGNVGTYAIYADAYRLAAKRVGVLPREMQSITWEAVRTLFKQWQKNDEGLKNTIIKSWEGVDRGRSAERARNTIRDAAGGFEPPAWAGPHYQPDDFARHSSYQRELDSPDGSGGGPGGLPGGVGSGDPGRTAGARGGRRVASPVIPHALQGFADDDTNQAAAERYSELTPRYPMGQAIALTQIWLGSEGFDLRPAAPRPQPAPPQAVAPAKPVVPEQRSLLTDDEMKFGSAEDGIGVGEHATTTDPTGQFWGNEGAGVVFLAEDTGKVMVSYRSAYVNEPHTWGVWGGAFERGETPEHAAEREAREETGYSGPMRLESAYVFRKDGFRYTTFIATVPKEFKPKLDWESEGWQWCTPGEWPSPVHYGLRAATAGIMAKVGTPERKTGKTAAASETIEDFQDLAAYFDGLLLMKGLGGVVEGLLVSPAGTRLNFMAAPDYQGDLDWMNFTEVFNNKTFSKRYPSKQITGNALALWAEKKFKREELQYPLQARMAPGRAVVPKKLTAQEIASGGLEAMLPKGKNTLYHLWFLRTWAARNYRQIGEPGSSRVVFRIDADHALKIAMNTAGIAQNRTESHLAQNYRDLPITQVHHVIDGGAAMVVDFAHALDRSHFLRDFGMEFDDFCQGVTEIARAEDKVEAQAFLADMPTPAQALLKSLAKHHLPATDLRYADQWGDLRGHSVLIDYGLTHKVWKDHYKKQRQTLPRQAKVARYLTVDELRAAGREASAGLRVYRSAKDDFVGQGYSFAEAPDDAAAYLGNPGFGGEHFYTAVIPPDQKVLDLTESPWETLSDLLGETVEFRGEDFPQALQHAPSLIDGIAEHGYDWVKYIDDYPGGCVTYTTCSSDAEDIELQEIPAPKKASKDDDYAQESKEIRERKGTKHAREPHGFEAAEWTFKNGHPRCKWCGDEEPENGICKGIGGKTADGPPPAQAPAKPEAKVDATETPQFKAWFGRSKVVDAQGRPLKVYHGTGQTFKKFDVSMSGLAQGPQSNKGLWFTDSPLVADGYALGSVGNDMLPRRIQKTQAPQVYPVYLKLVNPLVLQNNMTTENAFIKARADGNDGIIFRDADEGGERADTFVVFSPGQVKSAIGNRGTFNPEDHRLTAKQAGTEWMDDPHYFHKRINTLLEKLKALPYSSEIKVFGSVAKGKEDPGDLDIFMDLSNLSWEEFHKHPASKDLMDLAKTYYGSLDPFVLLSDGLIVRDDYARGWQGASNDRKILADAQREGKPLGEVSGIKIAKLASDPISAKIRQALVDPALAHLNEVLVEQTGTEDPWQHGYCGCLAQAIADVVPGAEVYGLPASWGPEADHAVVRIGDCIYDTTGYESVDDSDAVPQSELQWNLDGWMSTMFGHGDDPSGLSYDELLRDVLKKHLGGSGGPKKSGLFIKQAAMATLTTQEARDRKMFGPVYHGTTESSREKIKDEGFSVFEGDARTENVRNGYDPNGYGATNFCPPVHHLGYGVYFTTVKAIAKMYNGGSVKGLKAYYLDVPRLETINFGSPNTMMKWWIGQGYDPQLARKDRIKATQVLTDTMKSKWDAVWFKGSGMHRLLDGDQVCVFDPSKVYVVDDSSAEAGSTGSKVRRKTDGMVGVVTGRREIPEGTYERMQTALADLPEDDPRRHAHWGRMTPETRWYLTVKWKVGGTEFNVYDTDVEPLAPKTARLFRKAALRQVKLRQGTTLYHGTNVEFDETDEGLTGPAWVSDSPEVAWFFAKRTRGTGKPRVIEYRLGSPETLWRIQDGRDLDRLAIKYLRVDPEEDHWDQYELAEAMDTGWIIPNNYPTGADILLANPDLDYVKTHYPEGGGPEVKKHAAEDLEDLTDWKAIIADERWDIPKALMERIVQVNRLHFEWKLRKTVLHLNDEVWLSWDPKSLTFDYIKNIESWVAELDDAELETYAGEPQELYNDALGTTLDEFRASPSEVYHWTNSEALEAIKAAGVLQTTGGSGLTNQFESGVFTTVDPEELADGVYGDVCLTIDLPRFLKDYPETRLAFEPEVVEALSRESIAGSLGVEMNNEVSSSGGMSYWTIIVGSAIPTGYISVGDDPSGLSYDELLRDVLKKHLGGSGGGKKASPVYEARYPFGL